MVSPLISPQPTPSPAGAVAARSSHRDIVASSKLVEKYAIISQIDDPWDCLEVAAQVQPWMAWAASARDFCWLAWGAALPLDDFWQVPQFVSSSGVREQLRGLAVEAAAAPSWVGGSAFFSGSEPMQGVWRGWPRAAGWAPQAVLMARAEGGSLLIVRATDGRHAEQHLARVKKQLLNALSLRTQRPRQARQPHATVVDATVVDPTATVVDPTATVVDPTVVGQGAKAGHHEAAVYPFPLTSAVGRGNGQARRDYERLVARAARASDQPPLRKLVVAREHDWPAPPGHHFDALASVRALRQQQPQATCFALSLPSLPDREPARVFIGATPERLVSLCGTELTTHALAATAHANGGDLNSHKMQHEHQLVIEGLRRDLTPLCTELHVTSPKRLQAGTLQHLASDISGTLKHPVALQQVTRCLHPSAALGGFPRGPAMAWLQRHEALERGWYGGPLGYLSGENNGEVVVAIRSVMLHPKLARAYVGAGIVPASLPQEEWRETEAKLTTVAQALRCRPHAAQLPHPASTAVNGFDEVAS